MDEHRAAPSAAPDPRPVLAALGNPHVRRVYAEVVLGAAPDELGRDLGAARRRRAVSTLLAAGLVEEVDGRLVEVPEAFTRLLGGAPAARTRGPERFLDHHGRLQGYPRVAADHHALLRLVAERAVGEDEVLTEAELGERLARFTDDTATLRRSLVEAELLERTRSGSEYARVTD